MNKKAFTLVEILITIVILGIIAAIVIPQFTTKVIKVSTAANQEMYYNAYTLKPTNERNYIENPDGKPLRLEFEGIKNGWIEINGYEPEEHWKRVDAAKNMAILLEILTEEEIALFKTSSSRLELNNKTIIKLTR